MPSRKKGAEEKRGVGRPRLPEAEARTQRVVVHLRRRDFETIEKMAAVRDAHVGRVVREIIERAVARRRK